MHDKETKQGFGTAALCRHPETVRKQIRKGVEKALTNTSRFSPFKIDPPYRMKLRVHRERGSYVGAEKTGSGVYVFEINDFLEVMNAFNALK